MKENHKSELDQIMAENNRLMDLLEESQTTVLFLERTIEQVSSLLDDKEYFSAGAILRATIKTFK